MAWAEQPRDPSRHLLVWRGEGHAPDGSRLLTAVPLTEAGHTLAEAVANARSVDAAIESEADPLVEVPYDTLSLSRQQASAIATMFRDFALRVLPGTTVGPLVTDDSLSELAERCAGRMRQRTMQYAFADPRVAADPARHFVTLARYVSTGDGRQVAVPVELDAPVADWRSSVAAGRVHEPNVTYAYPDVLSLSLARTRIIAELLHEYAARMRPGVAVGAVGSSGELSRFLEELATDLQTRDT
ncbi:hypothetical protein GCM10009682_11050 [Luedemannella flava]|uniref:Uncharacterized protein n=1 Tax=Luedemannella flava TaxID=349316 RepID=A0ABN2LJW9_9ACTN